MEYRNWRYAKQTKGNQEVSYMIIMEPQIARSILVHTPEGENLDLTVPQGRRLWKEYSAKGFKKGKGR